MSFNTRAKKQQLIRPDANFELASLPPTQIAAKWDKASKLQRCDILSSFIERFHSSTAAEIERSFGGSSQLFFARITATLRLSYKTMAANCDRYGILMFMAIGLFLQGQKFLTSFAEVGGIQLVCDFVASIPNCGVIIVAQDKTNQAADKKHNNNDDSVLNPSFTAENSNKSTKSKSNELQATIEAAAKTRAIRLLIHIANSGRVYREMICEDGGLQHLVNATTFETDDGVLELTGSLFLSLGHGNPRRVKDVHGALLHIARTGNDSAALCSASTLRALQVARIGPTSLAAMVNSNNTNNSDESDQQQKRILPSSHQHSGSKIGGLLLPETTIGTGRDTNATNATTGNATYHGTETESTSENNNNNTSSATNIHDVPPHLAGAIVSPIQLTGPTPSATAAQTAENEAGLALYMDSLFHLLRSPSIRVRFEGIELLSLSAPGQGLLHPMLKRAVDILDDVDTTLHAISALPYERERAFIHLHASCVRLLYALLTHKDEYVSVETARIFDNRLLHLCLGRFIRVTQDAHSRSILSQSLKHSATAQSFLRTTSAPTAAPGVQDAIRILKALLTGEGFSENTLAVDHVDSLRRAVESWLRKTLDEDELFAPLLDTSSSLNDPFVIAIAEKLSDANRRQLEVEDKLEKEEEGTNETNK